jgi:cell wall-associated NlpC family hydrolase
MGRAVFVSLGLPLLLGWALAGARPAAAAPLESPATSRSLRRLDARLRQLLFGQALVAQGRRWLGVAYRWGGKDEAHGFDCSGYTRAVYAALGVDIPAGAQAQWMAGQSVDRADLMPGDLLFFTGQGSPFHVGLYAGEGQFLHAPGRGGRVRLSPLGGRWSGARFLGARRWPPPARQLEPTIPDSKELNP